MSETIIDKNTENNENTIVENTFDTTEIVKAYEEKLDRLEKQYKEELEVVKKNHAEQIRAILAGQKTEEIEETEEKSEEDLIKESARRIAQKLLR